MVESKIFDESYVDCNDCQHYWDDSCDGVPKDDIRPCTAFKATKRTDIPVQLEKLSKNQNEHSKHLIWVEIILILHLLNHLLPLLEVFK